MIIFLLVVGIALIYAAIGTAMGLKAYWVFLERDLPKEKNEYRYTRSSREDANTGGVLVGIFWPVGVWILIAQMAVIRAVKKREAAAADSAERDRLVAKAMKELESQ